MEHVINNVILIVFKVNTYKIYKLKFKSKSKQIVSSNLMYWYAPCNIWTTPSYLKTEDFEEYVYF